MAIRSPDRATPAAEERILVLVPHDPVEDPRVGWVVDLCREIARTDVIGVTWSTARRAREYDGRVFLERANMYESASSRSKLVAGVASIIALRADQGRPPLDDASRLARLRSGARGLAAFAGAA